MHPELDDNRERTGRMLLDLQKSNHGRVGFQLAFRWDTSAEMFIPEQAATDRAEDRAEKYRGERVQILLALAACEAENIVVPAAMSGPRTLHSVLSIRSEFPASLKNGRDGRKRFAAHVERMRQEKLVEVVEYRDSHRHPAIKFVLTEAGRIACEPGFWMVPRGLNSRNSGAARSMKVNTAARTSCRSTSSPAAGVARVANFLFRRGIPRRPRRAREYAQRG